MNIHEHTLIHVYVPRLVVISTGRLERFRVYPEKMNRPNFDGPAKSYTVRVRSRYSMPSPTDIHVDVYIYIYMCVYVCVRQRRAVEKNMVCDCVGGALPGTLY